MKKILAIVIAVIVLAGAFQFASARDWLPSFGDSKAAATITGDLGNAVSTDISDVSGHWAEETIRAIVEEGWMTASNGRFRPDDQLTRAEYVAILARITGAELPESGNLPFTDVSGSAWYRGALIWANDNHIISGTSYNSFSPNSLITRQDAVLTLDRTLGLINWSLNRSRTPSVFSDIDTVSEYARDAVNGMASTEVIVPLSDGTFRPREAFSRAELTVWLVGLLQAKVA